MFNLIHQGHGRGKILLMVLKPVENYKWRLKRHSVGPGNEHFASLRDMFGFLVGGGVGVGGGGGGEAFCAV